MWTSSKFGRILVGFTLVALAAISRTFGDGPFIQGERCVQPATSCPAAPDSPACPTQPPVPMCPTSQLAPVAAAPTLAPPQAVSAPAADSPPPLPPPPAPRQVKAAIAPPPAPVAATPTLAPPQVVSARAASSPPPKLPAPRLREIKVPVPARRAGIVAQPVPRRPRSVESAAVGTSAVIVGCRSASCCCDDAQICVTIPRSEVCLNETGVRAFSELMHRVAARGVENAAARGFNSTSAAPDCKGCGPAKK